MMCLVFDAMELHMAFSIFEYRMQSLVRSNSAEHLV